eukprot:scaffold34632_cov168-Amphora_coffeaeformis.AAC.4
MENDFAILSEKYRSEKWLRNPEPLCKSRALTVSVSHDSKVSTKASGVCMKFRGNLSPSTGILASAGGNVGDGGGDLGSCDGGTVVMLFRLIPFAGFNKSAPPTVCPCRSFHMDQTTCVKTAPVRNPMMADTVDCCICSLSTKKKGSLSGNKQARPRPCSNTYEAFNVV